MSVDIFGRSTSTNSQGFASDTKLQGLKAEDKLMKIDIMNVKTNMQSNDDDIHDHLIRIKFLEQELENGLTKQKQDIITETKKYMNQETFDLLKVKSIAYISDHGTQITNWASENEQRKSFQTKIDYIETGIRQLEDYINNTLTKMQLKYTILDDETQKTLHTINNHLKNIKEKHDNFKKDVKKDVANFIEGTTSTLTLYDNKIRQLSDNIISLTESLDNKIKELKDETIKETIQILYDSGMFGLYENTDELLEKYLTFNSRRRGGTIGGNAP